MAAADIKAHADSGSKNFRSEFMIITRLVESIGRIVKCSDGIIRHVTDITEKGIHHDFKAAENGTWIFGVVTPIDAIKSAIIGADSVDERCDPTLVTQRERPSMLSPIRLEQRPVFTPGSEFDKAANPKGVDEFISEQPFQMPDEVFIRVFNHLADIAHHTAKSSGWCDEKISLVQLCRQHAPELEKFADAMIAGCEVALIQSEASEWLENLRLHQIPDDKIPEFTGAEAEAADIIIRIMHVCRARNMRVAEAVVAKSKMNTGRPKKHGGKLF